jgi:cytochrome c oxidase assembly protein subunit 15
MKYFKKLLLLTTITAFCLVVLGAYVRLSDAGLGCPDWPGCFGTLSVPESQTAIENAELNFPSQHIETAKAWKEMIHRYLAGFLGLMIILIGIISYKNKKILRVNPIVPYAIVLLVIFQALLGMWTVTLLLKPIVVSAHLIGGMTTLGLLTFVTHRYWGKIQTNILKYKHEIFLVRFSLFVLFIQIFLGGWTSTNYAGLACTDFPTCHGNLIPNLNFNDAFDLFRDLGKLSDGSPLPLAVFETIQWIHRLGALITWLFFGYLASVILKYKTMRSLGYILLFVITAQFIVGVANLLLHLPTILAVMHTFGAASLVVLAVILNSRITKLRS